jgi:hypothetical protein
MLFTISKVMILIFSKMVVPATINKQITNV